MHFGSLDFIVSMEGELAWANGPATPPQSISLDVVIETLGELWLHTPGTHALKSDLRPFAANSEFVGMMDYVLESFYDLIMEGSKTISDSDSSGGATTPHASASR